jgi:hypothetical protein
MDGSVWWRTGHQSRRTSRWTVHAALLAALCVGALFACASPASAVIVHLRSGKALSYEPVRGQSPQGSVLRPFDALFTNLDYNGGPVMPSNTNYAVYWDPSGAPAYPADYQPGINRYFEDLAHDSGGHENVDSVSTQYNDAAGEFASYSSHFGGALIDTHAYPKNGCSRAAICLTDAQLQAELTRYVKELKLPTDLTHEYFLLPPPGVESCFEASGFSCSAGVAEEFAAFCAYHGNIPLAGGQLIYANDPYVAGGICDDGNHPNGTTADATLSGGLSHEHNESITDPEPNNAWTDFATGGEHGYENGDKCRTFEAPSEFGTPLGKAENGASYNQVINGHLYWYQQEWSNQKHVCKQRFTFSGEAPTATFTSTAGTGNEMTLDATGSTAPSGVSRYSWQFNDTGSPGTPTETSTATVKHKFPGTGTYNVALTIFASDGTSIGAARSVTVGDESPTAAFSVTTITPTAEAPVSFDASESKDPDGSISKYDWAFGDATTATGATPNHTYSLPGTYGVTLTVTDSAGLTASVTHNVIVHPVPPVVVTEAASAITQTAATLNGKVNPKSATVSTCEFEYGTTVSYGSHAPCASGPGSGSSPVAVSGAASGLSPDTTYHFRLVATNAGGTSKGEDKTLITAAEPGHPTVVTEAASALSQTSATLNATVNPKGTTVIDCHFEYGTTTSYTTSVPCASLPGSGTSPVATSAVVAGLIANTTYHYRVVATNSGGTTNGADLTLTTKPEPPTVVTEGASALTQTSATLNGTVNPKGTTVSNCEVKYGTTSSYGSHALCATGPGSGSSPVAVSAAATGLAPNTTYHYRLFATNSGGTTEGEDKTFTTAPEPAPEPPIVVVPVTEPVSTTPATLVSVLGSVGTLSSVERKAPAVPDAELVGVSLTATPTGAMGVRVSCPATESTCTGTITLKTLSAVSAAHRKAILTLALGAFKVSGGHVASLTLHLSSKARGLLARSHVLRGRAVILAHDPSGATHSAATLVTIHLRRPKH